MGQSRAADNPERAVPMAEAGDDFWRFSLALYAEPGVAPACLRLQDLHGKDVVLALWCLWLGASGRGRLDAPRLAEAEAAVAPWRQRVIEPVRKLRKSLKDVPGAEEVYERIKGVELGAERAAHDRLALLSGPARKPGTGDAAANLALYLDAAAMADAAPILAAPQIRSRAEGSSL